jgi:outer membrane protein OmpA-like peptidoglycan-associated protein
MGYRCASSVGLAVAGGLVFATAAASQPDPRPESRIQAPSSALHVQRARISGPSPSVDTVRSPVQLQESEVTGRGYLIELPSRGVDDETRLPADVLFRTDEAALTGRGRQLVRQVAAVILAGAQEPVIVEGHADCRGSTVHNVDLSLRRAVAVRRALERVLDGRGPRLHVEAFGEARPVAPNVRPDGTDSRSGRRMNRRVEVRLGDPSATPTASELRRPVPCRR